MWTTMVTVVDIFLQDVRDRALTDEEQMIQARAADRTEEPFAHGIGIRRANGCFEGLDVGASGHPGESRTILAVVVSDQVFGSVAKRCCLAQVLSNPGISWGSGHADMNHASRAKLDDEEGVELPKEQVDNGQEVAGPELMGVIV